jgi:class 3 adenylate cyclase
MSAAAYTVIGDTVTVAAAAASDLPGEIEVKGKRDPVDAYLVDAQFG